MLDTIAALILIFSPITELEVVTSDGQVYVAGSGDTCVDAFHNAVFPSDDWVELRCIERYPTR